MLLLAILGGTITTLAQEPGPPYSNNRQSKSIIISGVDVYKYPHANRAPRVSVYLSELVQHHGETKAMVFGVCEAEVSVSTEKEIVSIETVHMGLE